MKKWLMLVLTIFLSLSVIVGCGSGNDNAEGAEQENNSAEQENNVEESKNTEEENEANEANEEEAAGMYEDGVYFAKDEENIDGDWRYWVLIKVENGSIADVEWNATSRAGAPDKVAFSESGEYGMKEKAGAVGEWHEQAQAAIDYLIEVQDPALIELNDEGKTDTISGATISLEPLVTLTQKALADGPVEAGSYTDGFYYAEADEFAKGWKYFASVIVRNGNIVDAVFNGYNEEEGGPHKIAFAASGEYGMVNASEIGKEWHEQAAATVDYLIEVQDPAAVELDEEGKTDAISGATIGVGDFFKLVEDALAAGPQ